MLKLGVLILTIHKLMANNFEVIDHLECCIFRHHHVIGREKDDRSYFWLAQAQLLSSGDTRSMASSTQVVSLGSAVFGLAVRCL